MKKATLITWATSWIWYEMSYIFAQNKHNLVLTARSENILKDMQQDLIKKYHIEVEIIPLDLSCANSANEIYNFTQKNNIFVDHLVNNAWFWDYGEFVEKDWKKQSDMIQLNITSLTQLCYVYGKKMKQEKTGKILNVASTAAFQPGPLMSVYFATKAYVLHFSEALSNELEPYGVGVTVLCPGATATKFKIESEMADIKMFKNAKFAKPFDVALYWYNALMSKKIVAVHGWFNKFLVNSNRFWPRFIILKTLRNLMEK